MIGGGGMVEHRSDIRADCEDKCVLHQGVLHHLATVKNISFGGALVHFNTMQPTLHIGENCDITVNGEYLREYSCEVVRIEAPDIALKFTGMRKLKVAIH